VKVLSVDGSRIRDITISDITMENVMVPIFVRLGARLNTYRPGETARPPGVIENLVIRNITATSATTGRLTPPSGVFITGIPGHRAGPITLENISIKLPGGGELAHGRQVLPENISVYPEINRFGPLLPAHGLYARHVKDFTVKNVTFELTGPDLRPIIVCQSAERVLFDGITAVANPAAESAIRFEAVTEGRLNALQISGNPAKLLLEEPTYEAPATGPAAPARPAPAAH
jgi:hypothetical protein